MGYLIALLHTPTEHAWEMQTESELWWQYKWHTVLVWNVQICWSNWTISPRWWEEFALYSKNFSFSCERDLISFALYCKDSEGEGWKVGIQPSAAEPAAWIFYICGWDPFGIMSVHNECNFGEGEILYTIFLIIETSIVWTNELVWIPLL